MPRVCITVPGQNAQPYRFSLDRQVVRFGRADDNDIVIESPSVSSYHCEMHRIEGGYILKDSDSTNGIKLEGTRMEVIDLENSCEVHVGDAELDFELTNEELAALATEEHAAQEQVKLPPTKKKKKTKEEPEPAERAPTPPVRAPHAGHPLHSAQSDAGANFAITMVLLALAVLSFYFGMAMRHQSTTKSAQFPEGRSLWNDLVGKTPPAEQASEPAAEE